MIPIQDLLAQAAAIKNETVENNNSANRVGAWMEEVIPYLEDIADKAESGGSEKTLQEIDDEKFDNPVAAGSGEILVANSITPGDASFKTAEDAGIATKDELIQLAGEVSDAIQISLSKGKNIFNFDNDIIDGYFINRVQGYRLDPLADYGITKPIKVEPSTDYKLTVPHNPNGDYILLDENKEFILGNRQYNLFITTTTDTQYIQFQLYNPATKAAFIANNGTQIELGQSATTVEVYTPQVQVNSQDISIKKLYEAVIIKEGDADDSVISKATAESLIESSHNNRVYEVSAIENLAVDQTIKNIFKQPTEANWESQFNSSSQMLRTAVENDNTLPFTPTQLPKFLRYTYDGSISINTQIQFSKADNTAWKYLTGLWIRKSDIENIPTSVDFFYQEIGSWISITKEDLLNVRHQQIYENGVMILEFNVVTEVNGWIFLSVLRYNTDKTPTGASKWFYFKVRTTSGDSGKIDICNMMMLESNLTSPINKVIYKPTDIYISETDTIGHDPSFKGKVLSITGGNSQEDVDITKYVYGAKIQNFLSKARDYKFGRWNAKAPKVVLIGDSIFGGSWTETFKTMLNVNFDIPLENVEIHWYGGGTIDYMLPFLEDVSIYPNPDLVIFGEYENMTIGYQVLIENYITMLRRFTSADIMITTWSMARDAADLVWNNGTPDKTLVFGNAGYTDFHWYRDLARKYNCELFDSNQAIVDYIAAGNSPAAFYSTGPHLSDYESVFTPELNKHFQNDSWNETAHNTNGTIEKEEIIAATESMFDGFGNKFTFSDISKWVIQTDRSIRCSTTNETVEIKLKNSIGFELISAVKASGSVGIEIKKEGGAYQLPSTLLNNGKPLQYATEIRCISYASDDQWRLKRPFKKAVVNSNILADGVLKSGQYIIRTIDVGGIKSVDVATNYIEISHDWTATFINGFVLKINGSTANDGTYTVASSSYQSGTNRTRIFVDEPLASGIADGFVINGVSNRQFPTLTLFDPDANPMTTFNFSTEVSVLGGALTFPLKYNGSNNYYITAATLDDWGQPANANWVIGDEYEFYIVSNWIDNAVMTSKFNRVFGYERGDYTVKLIINSSTIFDLYAIINFT